MSEHVQPHGADGVPVISVIGSDGLRMACRTCDETVYERDGRFLHFRAELNPLEEARDE